VRRGSFTRHHSPVTFFRAPIASGALRDEKANQGFA
jgi:hypothetical protein